MTAALPDIVFMGTPEFAVPALRRLATAGCRIRLVVTQPDRPKGRGKKLSPPPVKVLAEEWGIPVYQPERIRTKEALEHVFGFGAECAVVVAYGQILPQAFLDAYPLGALNVHASLLPRFRGAAPIHRVLLEGEHFTGISIMLLDSGMDTGPVLSQRVVKIEAAETFLSLHDKLAEVGADLLFQTLTEWKSGSLHPHPQEDVLATYAPPLGKEENRLIWSFPALRIVNAIRAFDPWPGAYTFCQEKRVKCFGGTLADWKGEGKPGEIVGHSERGLVVLAGDGCALIIAELQMEGQRRLPAADFLRGRSMPVGTCLE
jgi:methionyl-tRNA formyltransferase